MSLCQDYLQFPASATIGEILRAYVERQAQWWWLLIRETAGQYSVCSFGSLLPYLTGRTEHIVHNIGDCAICCGIDPMLWQDTSALVEEALADTAICSRLLADLPIADLPTIEAGGMDESARGAWLVMNRLRACGVTENGMLCGVEILQYMGVPGGLPDF
jgi:hypothetical protein